jgi:hypothetical protein
MIVKAVDVSTPVEPDRSDSLSTVAAAARVIERHDHDNLVESQPGVCRVGWSHTLYASRT